MRLTGPQRTSEVIAAFGAALLLSACQDGSERGAASGAAAGTSSTVATTVLPDDLAIAALLYAGSPRTPAGFLDDPAPASFAQVTTLHIKSRHIDATAARQYELCSDDWSEALAWSEARAAAAPVYANLVSDNETEAYFEFARVRADAPTHYERARVYRCSYVDRNGVDLEDPTTAAGTFNRRPLDATALGQLSEYLWRFTSHNNADHAVVLSAADDSGNGLVHVLTLAELVRDIPGSDCDRVALAEWRISAAPGSGALTQTTVPLRDFLVERVGGVVFDCN